jgi:hypothetical protein
MASSKAATVAAYLAELPADRRATVAAVRRTVRKNLPRGYRETMNLGMITWEIPLKRYPDTYNSQPLCYAALASQKQAVSLYLTRPYQSSTLLKVLRDGFKRAGKKLNVGKSFIRFRKAEDLPLDVIGKVVARTPPDEFIARYEASRKHAR